MPIITGKFGPISQIQDPTKWGPLIEISLCSYPDSDGAPVMLLRRGVVALIDTGAQMCVIDGKLARELNLKDGKGAYFNQLGHEISAPSYLGTIFLPEIPCTYSWDLLESPLGSPDVPFQAILGWTLLRDFDLALSQKRGLVELTWIRDR